MTNLTSIDWCSARVDVTVSHEVNIVFVVSAIIKSFEENYLLFIIN
jgi:hypothetical protein